MLIKLQGSPNAPGTDRALEMAPFPVSPENAGEEICVAIRDAFLLLDDSRVTCSSEVLENADGDEILRVQLRAAAGTPPFVRGWGELCISPKPVVEVDPVIEDFSPREGPAGTRIRITGGGFGDDPHNLCVILRDELGRVITDVRVVDVSPSEIIGELGVIWIDDYHSVGHLEIYFGQGVSSARLGSWFWQASPTLPLPPPAIASETFEMIKPDSLDGCFRNVHARRRRVSDSWSTATGLRSRKPSSASRPSIGRARQPSPRASNRASVEARPSSVPSGSVPPWPRRSRSRASVSYAASTKSSAEGH